MQKSAPIELYTQDLILRELNPEIYNQVMVSFSDSEIKTFFGLPSDEELQNEKLRFQQGMTMSGKSFLYFHLLDKINGVVMGWCGYHTWFTQHLRAEIGYVLNEDVYKGKGYMSQALPAVIKYGFETMNLHRIEALISPDNIPSLKLIKRSGFTEEGILREHYMKSEKLEDSIIFSLLRQEYFQKEL